MNFFSNIGTEGLISDLMKTIFLYKGTLIVGKNCRCKVVAFITDFEQMWKAATM